MPIYRLLFVWNLVCLRLRISPPTIHLAASNFARRFIGVRDRESAIFVNFALPKPKIGRIGERATISTTFTTITLWLPNTRSRVHGRRIGMCGYTSVSEDGRTCFEFELKPLSVNILVCIFKCHSRCNMTESLPLVACIEHLVKFERMFFETDKRTNRHNMLQTR